MSHRCVLLPLLGSMLGIAVAQVVVADGASCAKYHMLTNIDPSGPLQTPDGTWHVFPIGGGWAHCTAPDLVSGRRTQLLFSCQILSFVCYRSIGIAHIPTSTSK